MKSALRVSLLAMGAAILAFGQTAVPPSKVGVIHIQNAIIATKEGQKAAADLKARFEPRQKELEGAEADINTLRDRLQKGANTLSPEQKAQLSRDVEVKTRALRRQQEDAQADFDQEQQKVLQELGGRMIAVIDKYAQDHGYAVVIDVSAANSPVVYVASSADITNDIVALYDKGAPPAGAASPAPATPRPAPPAKKQPGAPR